NVFQSPRNDLIPGSGPAQIRGTTVVHVGFDSGNFTAQPGVCLALFKVKKSLRFIKYNLQYFDFVF
ncbi:MAG: hypothetical protein AAF485_20860, partial [Chloroflexota bacterium]